METMTRPTGLIESINKSARIIIDRYYRYKEMSAQELGHATALHDFAVQDIEKLKSVYPEIPPKMMEKWEKSHVDFVEKAAWIRQMQAM